jgi:hypothetical protein
MPPTGLPPECSHISGTIVSGTLMMGLRECFTPQKKVAKSGLFDGRIRRRPSCDKNDGVDFMFRLQTI